MGSKNNTDKTKKKKDKGFKKGKNSKFITRVVQYKMLPKMYLRGYAAGGGGSMLNNDGEAASKHFTMKKILSDLDTADNKFDTELTRRPAMGISMACGTVDSLIEVTTRNLPKLDEIAHAAVNVASQASTELDVPPALHSYSMTGVPAAQRIWMSNDGRKIRKAMNYLNTAVERKRTTSDTKKALRTLRDHFGNTDSAKARMKDYARLADFSSRIYGGSVAQMELTALFCDQKKWAKLIQEVKLQHALVQKWVRSPGDERLFISGFAEAIIAKCTKEKPRNQAKPGLPGTDDSEAADDSDSHESKSDSDQSHTDTKVSDKKDSDDEKAASDSDATVSSKSDVDKPAATKQAGKNAKQQKQDDQSVHKLTWNEWHKIGIRDGTNLTKAIERLESGTLQRLAAGIENSDGIPHAEAAIDKANAILFSSSEKRTDEYDDHEDRVADAVRYDSWSLKDLQLFEAEAAALNIKQDMSTFKASQIVKLLCLIPEPLRVANGLPVGTKERDYAKLTRDCPRSIASIFKIVRSTKLSWIEKAHRVFTPQHNVSFEPEFSGGGLLRAVASDDTVTLATREAVAEVIVRVDAGDLNAEITLKQMEAEVLRGFIDEDVAGSIYENAFAFCNAYAKAEPTKEQIREFLKPLSEDLRTALCINKDSKFEKSKIRPHGWKQDACRAFSVYCLAFAAWIMD